MQKALHLPEEFNEFVFKAATVTLSCLHSLVACHFHHGNEVSSRLKEGHNKPTSLFISRQRLSMLGYTYSHGVASQNFGDFPRLHFKKFVLSILIPSWLIMNL